MILHFCIFLFLWTSGRSQTIQGDPVAYTPLGIARGYTKTSRSGRTFMAFSGLPYAKPPVGELSYQNPQPAEPWRGVREAKVDGPMCTQLNYLEVNSIVMGKEDCLYLSVYTHDLRGQYPVLVHIHGGLFVFGFGPKNSNPNFMMDEDVLVVDINYRVGALGFLSFEDKDMPGNIGLKDQVLALHWVQRNIASFGGDPNRVTIVGEGAGGASVYHHIISPLSRGLFHGAIAESGSSYGQWSIAPKGYARSLAFKLLSFLNITYTTTPAAIAHLRSIDPRVVVSQLAHFRVWQVDPLATFGPVFEPKMPGAFISDPISEWNHNPVPLLTGTTSTEGSLRTFYLLPYGPGFYNYYTDTFDLHAPLSLLYFASSSNPDKVTKQVREFYFKDREITQNDWINITMMYGDSLMTISIMEGANKHTGNVFFYYFDYIGKYYEEQFGPIGANRSIVFGVPHTFQKDYLWDYDYIVKLRGKDLEVSKRLVKVWTDFVKFGDPSPAISGLYWPTWTPQNHRYIHIDQEGDFKLKEGFAEDRYNFWKSTSYRDKYN